MAKAKKDKSSVPTTVENRSTAPQPVDPFDAMRRGMDEMMGRMLRSWPSFEGLGVRSDSMRMPSMDIAETDKAFEVKVDLPGMEDKDVELSVDGDTLSISAQHSEEHEKKDKTWHLTERRSGSFRRSLQLPANVQRDKITASFDKGVLTVNLPKGKASQTRQRIPIQSA